MGRVGEYELLQTIGTGAFSKVKLCKHMPTNTEFVAKILPKEHRDIENEVRVEISILRKVRHQNVVMLKEILESPRNFYIILEPVMGGDLCTLIMDRAEGMYPTESAPLFRQLLDGISACHSLGVAHRDLKPENILLTKDKMIKISDFGLSRLHRNSTGTAAPQEFATTLTGTLAYVAPEVLMGAYDAFLADIWSMGCILYVMCTCRFPFGSANGEELEKRIKACAIVPVPDYVNPAAKELIVAMLQKDPKKRPSLEQIANHPFLKSQAPGPELVLVSSGEIENKSFQAVDDGGMDGSFAMSPLTKPMVKRKLGGSSFAEGEKKE